MEDTNKPNQLPFAKDGESKIDLFKDKGVRKIFKDGEWWFSVKDVLEALTDTTDGTRYAADLRKKDAGLNSGYSEITRTLEYGSNGGRQQTTFIKIEGIFRLMQSVPTGKAEAFKKWLAKVGFERIQEMQNPELAVKRAMALYSAKGYSLDWIEARIQNKVSREQLENEWSKRGVSLPVQYAVLTDAISVETFGITTGRHKEIKGLRGQSLRDNMTPIELTLTTLGEQATKEIAKTRDTKGLTENLEAAKSGGRIAGVARLQIQEATKKPVVSEENYLTEKQRKNANLPDGLNDVLKNIVDSKKPSKDTSK
ncbi:MAG TPA: Bro-N domain-containing protein [Candidatus Paceibacterota bacterium]